MPNKLYLLILTHNRLGDVVRCFDSLHDTMRRTDVETWVLDNASTDGTREYVAMLECANAVLCAENYGVSGGRARLLGLVREKLTAEDRVVFLDSDTEIIDPAWLDVLNAALEPENIGLVGPGGSFILPDWSNFTAAIPDRECDVIAGFCQMFKAEALAAGICLDLSYGQFWTEDSDFCMQIRQAGFDVWCVPVGITHAAGHSGSAASEEQLQRNLARFRSKWRGKLLARCEGGY